MGKFCVLTLFFAVFLQITSLKTVFYQFSTSFQQVSNALNVLDFNRF